MCLCIALNILSMAHFYKYTFEIKSGIWIFYSLDLFLICFFEIPKMIKNNYV